MPRIKTITVLISLLTLNSYALAQSDTNYYRVDDLENDDHLNVRAEPDAGSADIGDLESGSQPYEVIGIDPSGEWGNILWLEGSGWVALRYMQPITIEQLADTKVPIGLTCAGSEPYWTIDIESQQAATLSTSESTNPLSVIAAKASLNQVGFPVAVEFRSATNTFVSVLRRSACSDGMTDITYSWTADVILQPELKLLSGCCELR